MSKSAAEVNVKVKLDNASLQPEALELENAIYDAEGKLVKKHVRRLGLTPQGMQSYTASFQLKRPHLWQGRKDPYLYKVVSRLKQKGRVIDEGGTAVGYP